MCSRITEWLFQSIGRLPYPYGGGSFPPGYNYVVRGAGLENPGITDDRAWVLDAFVQYVAILDTEMGSPVEDSVAFVMGKYGIRATENENSNVAATDANIKKT
ncbi:MAG: hypothetical protein ACYS0C_00135 [Planctomycetota bacterium]